MTVVSDRIMDLVSVGDIEAAAELAGGELLAASATLEDALREHVARGKAVRGAVGDRGAEVLGGIAPGTLGEIEAAQGRIRALAMDAGL